MGGLFDGVEVSRGGEADVQDYVWGWGFVARWWEDGGDGVYDVLVGDADGFVVDFDLDWCRVFWRGGDQGWKCRSYLP